MTQDDVYRKVGRGGAGNFYSTTEKPADTTPRDLEAQDEDTYLPPASPLIRPSTPVRAGRGGAGNVIDTTEPPELDEEERRVAERTYAAVQNQPPRLPVWSGRGGAGNYKADAAAQEAQREAEERSRLEELEKKAKEEAEGGLKLPEKVHHASEKMKGPA